MTTHMGQTPDNHVTLNPIGGSAARFSRIGPDGLPLGSDFTVPAGQVFVVTDVDWQFGGGPRRGTVTLSIFLRPIADPAEDGNRVFESTIVLSNDGKGGISESMTSGFVVSSAGYMHVETDGGGGGTLSHMVIRGYLCEES